MLFTGRLWGGGASVGLCTLVSAGYLVLNYSVHMGVEGQIWYCGREVPWVLLLGFCLREAFQSQIHTEKSLHNESR